MGMSFYFIQRDGATLLVFKLLKFVIGIIN